MAKISELSDGGSLLPTDFLIAVRSGGNVKVQADTINVDQIDLGDNEKIRLGNSQDLEIFHDATDSIINDNGTGSLKLQQGGSTKLEVTTTGIDVTGTVTTDNLTIDGGASAFGATASDAYIMRADGTGTAPFDLAGSLVYQPRSTDSNGYGDHLFYTGSTQKLRQKIAADGDISFYEDTGTTAKLFWDASTERLGLGTSSPQRPLHLSIGTDNTAARFESSDTEVALEFIDTAGTAYFRASGDYIKMGATQSDSLTILDGGNVGIGTSSPNALTHIYGGASGRAWTIDGADKLALENSSSVAFDIRTPASEQGLILFSDADARARGILGYAHSSDFMYFNTAGTERMRIDSSGNVGIGGSPSSTLDVGCGAIADPTLRIDSAAGGDPVLLFDTGATNRSSFIDFRDQGSLVGSIIYSHADDHLGFSVASNNRSEAARIDSSGNLLVGGTSASPGAGNTTTGFSLKADGQFFASSPSSNDHVFNINGTGNIISIRTSGTQVGSISVTGSATAYNTSSDQRLKENIVDAPSASDDIDAIQVRSFDWKADGSHQKYGMVAQELITVAPEAVSAPEDPEEMMGVDYSKLVPMMLKEIQSLRARVAQLEGAN